MNNTSRAARVGLVVIACGALVAACGPGSTGSLFPGSTSFSPGTSATPVPAWDDPKHEITTPGWAAQMIDTPLLSQRRPDVGPTSMPWEFVRSTGDVVQIVYAGGDGSCTKAVGPEVVETAATVTITVWATTDPTQYACPARGISGAGTLTLNTPLGSRTLVHAPISAQWASALPATN